jgi:hypothetical protein
MKTHLVPPKLDLVIFMACREPMMTSPIDILHNLAAESAEAASQEQFVQ